MLFLILKWELFNNYIMSVFLLSSYINDPALRQETKVYSGQPSKNAQYFFSNNQNCTLDSCVFNLRKVGTPPTGSIVARLYYALSVGRNVYIPYGSPLATSTTTINPSTLATTFALYTFNFTGSNRIWLSASDYFISLEVDSLSGGSSTNYIGMDTADNSTAPTPPDGNWAYYNGVNWQDDSLYDMSYTVYGATLESVPVGWIKA